MKDYSTRLFRISLFAGTMLFSVLCSATTYTFFTLTPANWTNANKWSPSYPGTTIAAGDEIILNGICVINEDVFIAGDMTNNFPLTIADLRSFPTGE